MSGALDSASAVGAIFRKELREILRDRRAVFFGFVFPLLLYPFLIYTTSLPSRQRGELAERALEVAVEGADEELLGLLEAETLSVSADAPLFEAPFALFERRRARNSRSMATYSCGRTFACSRSS